LTDQVLENHVVQPICMSKTSLTRLILNFQMTS